MARIENTIFISYRRKDISWALAVYQYLTSHKYNVFFDYTSIPSGDFEQIIVSNIKARAHFILILTPTALDRCNDPNDWLRREIETAIDERRNIIPLFFDGFNFGLPNVAEKLTGKLATIQRYNGLDIPSGYFVEAMDRLRERYLNVPLNAVIHPVSTEVRKVVKDEQIAVNQAITQKWEDIKELLTPSEEKTSTGRLTTGGSKPFNLRLYGIGLGILLLVVLGITGINALIQNNRDGITPTGTSPLPTNTVGAEASITPSLNTVTVPANTQIATDTAEPIITITPTLGIGSSKISAKDGMTLVYIPAGEFHMGIQGQERDEKPVHTVLLDAFWIDQTEVTNIMYAKCVTQGKCDPPSSLSSYSHQSYYGTSEFNEYPVIFVSWYDASAYCAWADRRLPTEAEWEKAARGVDQRNYPWGAGIDCSRANYYDGSRYCIGDTSQAKSYESGKSPYGLYEMAGNVWEWVADWYGQSYYGSSLPSVSNPLGPATGTLRVARGGSWADTDFLARASNRGSFDPLSKSNSRGFRCASSK